jgi:Lrp/AsnC family leucine-responsive transcriptional regulator
MTFHSESPLDATDWRILRELQQDARLSFHELGRRVSLSAPAVAERVRKLEDRGVITGYGAHVNPEKVGLGLIAFIQMHCNPEKCLLKTTSREDFPEVLELHRLNGEYCTLLKVAVTSMKHLNALDDRLSRHGTVKTTIARDSVLDQRVLDWEDPDALMNASSKTSWEEHVED